MGDRRPAPCIHCGSSVTVRRGHYWCELCRVELFPVKEDVDAEARELWDDEQKYKREISKPGGGSKNKIKKDKGKTRRVPWMPHET